MCRRTCDGRAGVARTPEAELGVLEERVPVAGLLRRVDVGLGDVRERAVGPQAEVAQAHRLVAVDDERREREEDLAGQLRLRLFLEVVGARVRLLEEPLEVAAVHGELVREEVGRERGRSGGRRPPARGRWSVISVASGNVASALTRSPPPNG